ncbi:MAG TPA: hypothetical protein VM691_00580, partial [Myxococcales bacterium]|nr:hypothetical protein [Myxococcales bacterium]
VDAILFNGGALAAEALASRLTSVLQSWQTAPLRRLRNDAPDLAVARGAAMYGLVRRGLGLRIGGGSPRTYYVGVSSEGSTGALCVVPRGAAEGVPQEVPDRTFGLVLGKPVRFRLFAASGYRPERPGDLVPVDDDLAELPPLQTVVQGDGTAQVRLRSTLTEIGTLELSCVADTPAEERALPATGGAPEARSIGGGERNPFEWVPEASRRGRAIPVYVALRTLGRRGVAHLVERSCALARRMAAALASQPDVTILNNVVLNQVLVRFGDSDQETAAVIAEVQREGTCWAGGTRWQGRTAMRLSISGYDTSEPDVDRSAAAIRRVHEKVAGERRGIGRVP